MLSYKHCKSVDKMQQKRSPTEQAVIESGRLTIGSTKSTGSSGPFSLINPNITLPTPPTPLPDYSDTSSGDDDSSSFPSDIEKPLEDRKARRGRKDSTAVGRESAEGKKVGKRVRRKPSSVRDADRARRREAEGRPPRNDDSSFSDDSLESSDEQHKSSGSTQKKQSISSQPLQLQTSQKEALNSIEKKLPGFGDKPLGMRDTPKIGQLGKDDEELSTLRSDKTTTGKHNILTKF